MCVCMSVVVDLAAEVEECIEPYWSLTKALIES
jgi:hypothetical protein